MREAFLVTGGSGGIGAATCAELARAGFKVFVGYGGNREAAEAIAKACDGQALHCDLTDHRSIAAAVECVATDQDPLAGLIHAASPPPRLVPLSRVERADLDLQWIVNVAGAHELIAGLVRHCLRKAKRGTIVGVLSQAMGDDGAQTTHSMSSYVVAKWGLSGLLRAVAAEYPWLKVRSVSPGFTDTAMLTAFDPRFIEMQREKGQVTSPEAVAHQIVQEVLSP